MGELHAAKRERDDRSERARGPSASSRGWRYVPGPAETQRGDGGPLRGTGPENMALDAALLEAVGAGAPPVLRLYRWDTATLSFGRNQPAAGLYDVEEAEARGIAFVRRPTGGQAVLHDDELTYAVVAPVAEVGKPRAAYRRINAALVAALRRLGLEASLAPNTPGPGEPAAGEGAPGAARGAVAGGHDWASACFRSPAAGEVVARGQKVVGSAQRTENRTILQHGSILVGGSQLAAEELLRGPAAIRAGAGSDELRPGAGGWGAVLAAGGNPGWTTVSAELGQRPGWEALAAAVVAGFEEVLGITLAPERLAVGEQERARRLEARFASGAWTWRR